MTPTSTRREFLRTATVATLAAASLPSALAQTDKKVTLAFVGVAHIHTPSFMDLLKKREDVKVKCIWDHDAARAGKSGRGNWFPGRQGRAGDMVRPGNRRRGDLLGNQPAFRPRAGRGEGGQAHVCRKAAGHHRQGEQ